MNRNRTAAGGAVLALALGGLTLAGPTAQADSPVAAPVSDCAPAYDVSQLKKGDTVNVRTPKGNKEYEIVDVAFKDIDA